MSLRFTKMESLENDFVVVLRVPPEESPWEEAKALERLLRDPGAFCRRYAHRRRGIGFDQLLILGPSDRAAFRMDIYNADGSPAEMCGNGIRCAAWLGWEQGWLPRMPLEVDTLAGLIRVWPEKDGVAVEMGIPVLEGEEIPITGCTGLVVNLPLELEGGETVRITGVSMGNPHAVLRVPSVTEAPVDAWGPRMAHHPRFPHRTNVEFVEVVDPTHLRVRVWERGVGETPACGTGACAAVVAARLWGAVTEQVQVTLPGGTLQVSWTGEGTPVILAGPARRVFEGVLWEI